MIQITAPRTWTWTPSRYRLARHIAEGDQYKEAGRKEHLSEATVKTYMYAVPEFRAYVDKITIENEVASRAGIMRRLMQVAKTKLPDAKTDKSTYLDYLKYLRELAKEDADTDTELTVVFK